MAPLEPGKQREQPLIELCGGTDAAGGAALQKHALIYNGTIVPVSSYVDACFSSVGQLGFMIQSGACVAPLLNL
jgi:hypothetical protein